MSERRALLILHGKQALNEAVRAAVEAKRKQGWELAVRLTWEAGDAQRLVEEAGEWLSQIIAGGGDGTLRDIAEALAAHPDEASLVLLPLGTANDFSRAAGIRWSRPRHWSCWTCRRATLTWAQSASRFS
jgi:diacylglycerol kinase family enzyme